MLLVWRELTEVQNTFKCEGVQRSMGNRMVYVAKLRSNGKLRRKQP
jgi:hypothetical protein